MSQQMSRAWLPKKSASGEAHDASGHVGKNYKEKTNDECHGLNVNRLCGPSCSWTGRDVNSVSTSFNIEVPKCLRGDIGRAKLCDFVIITRLMT